MKIEDMYDNSKLIIDVKDIKDIYNDLLNDINKNDDTINQLRESIDRITKQRLCDTMGLKLINLIINKSEYIEAKDFTEMQENKKIENNENKIEEHIKSKEENNNNI